MTKIFSSRAADDGIYQYCERLSQSDTAMSIFLTRVASTPMFKRLVAGVIKEHVNTTIDECFLTPLCARTGEVKKKRIAAPAEQIDIAGNGQVQNYAPARALREPMEEVKKNDHCDGPDHWNNQNRASPVAEDHVRIDAEMISRIEKKEK